MKHQLSDKQFQMFQLCRLQGRSAAFVADFFQESTVNVYTVCSRGTRALRRLVEEFQEELSPEEIPDEVLLRTAYDGLKAFRSAEREDATC